MVSQRRLCARVPARAVSGTFASVGRDTQRQPNFHLEFEWKPAFLRWPENAELATLRPAHGDAQALAPEHTRADVDAVVTQPATCMVARGL